MSQIHIKFHQTDNKCKSTLQHIIGRYKQESILYNKYHHAPTFFALNDEN